MWAFYGFALGSYFGFSVVDSLLAVYLLTQAKENHGRITNWMDVGSQIEWMEKETFY